MHRTRIPSPARSENSVTPRRKTRSTRSVGSPARSNASGRLTSIVDQFKEANWDCFAPSPLNKTVLTDNTEIERPRRQSWWKKVNHSKNISDVLEVEKVMEPNNILDDLEMEVLSQEKKDYSLDLPESSGSESISSIVIPQRKLFTQKENVPHDIFKEILISRKSMSKNKTNVEDKTVNIGTKTLFGQGAKRSRPKFPDALLNFSPEKTANQTKDPTTEAKTQTRSLFGNRQATKRKHIFADFIASESEDEVSEIQPKLFAFQRNTNPVRHSTASRASRGNREPSPGSSVTTDIEMDDWKMLPSSTMVEHQLDALAASTPEKKARLSKLSEAKESETGTISNNTINKTKLSNKSTSKNKSKTTPDQTPKRPELDKATTSKHNESKSIENKDKKETTTKERNSPANKTKASSSKLNNTFHQTVIEHEAVLDATGTTNKINNQTQVLNKTENRNLPVIDEKSREVTDIPSEANSRIINNQTYKINNDTAKADLVQDNDGQNIPSNSQLVSKRNIENEKEPTEKDTKLQVEAEKDDCVKTEREKHIDNVEEQEENNEEDAPLVYDEEEEQVDEKEEGQVDDEKENRSKDEKVPVQEENELLVENEKAQVQDEKEVEDDKEMHIKLVNEEVEVENDEEIEVEDDKRVQVVDHEEVQVENDEEVQPEHDEEVQVEDDEEVQVEDSEEVQVEDDEEVEHGEEFQVEDDVEVEDDEEDDVEVEVEDNEELQDEDDEEIQVEDDQEEDEEVDVEDNEESQNQMEVESEEEPNHTESDVENEEEDDQNEDDPDVDLEQDIEIDENQRNVVGEYQESEQEVTGEMKTAQEQENICADVQESEQEETEEINATQEAEAVTPNVTHDTTGRHRQKEVQSPEDILHNMSNQDVSFIAKGRNTSIRKTLLKNFTVRQSEAPLTESTGFDDGTKDSSAEGSGWDSHRTTRKTLRQTFGKDFTPRKSLRALVMEKSAKRQTAINEANAKLHQANSTEIPDMEFDDHEMIEESNHEISKRTKQTTLEMYLQKVKNDIMQTKRKIEAEVKHSLKTNPIKQDLQIRAPNKGFHKTNMKLIAPKPLKTKRTRANIVPLEQLPEEFINDLKYKPPKRFRPSNASWLTKRLYKFLETKLEPKYDYKARLRAEKLAENIYEFTRQVRKQRVAPPHAVAELKHELARLDVVNTHYEFYDFIRDYMPYEVKIKVVPDILNNIPLPSDGLFSSIIA